MSALVNDALTVLAHAEELELTERQQEALALLALVAGQDVEPAEGSDGTDGRWRIAPRVAPDRVISTVDPETRHAHKPREKRQDGYKAHVVVEPDTGLVTAAALTGASGPANSDAARGAELLEADASIGDEPVQALADSTYGSVRAARARAARRTRRRDQAHAVAPGRARRIHYRRLHRRPACRRRHLPSRHHPADLGEEACHLRRRLRGLPAAAAMRDRRARPEDDLTEHDQIKREHRARAKEPAFQAVCRQHRPMVERTIGWMTRGVAGNHAWWVTRAAGINLQRLLKLGLTRKSGTWALA